MTNGESAADETSTTQAPERQPQPLLLTVERAAQRLAIGRTALYALLGSGQLPSVRIGRSRRIPLSALNSYVQELINTPAPAPARTDS